MKRLLSTVVPLILLVLSVSCTKDAVILKGGKVIGEMLVGSSSGSVSVSVETSGRWIVAAEDGTSWVSTDVRAGDGNAAFTLYYSENASDAANVNPPRRARIIISRKESAVADTLILSQQGFGASLPRVNVEKSDGISVEFSVPELSSMTVAYCSPDGLDSPEDLAEWASAYDIAACGGSFIVSPEETRSVLDGRASVTRIHGVNFVAADLSLTDKKDSLFRALLELTYNAPGSGTDWVIGGQFYSLSMMQSCYDATPSWYPSDDSDPAFDTDRYAWMNNLCECLWLSRQDYVSTWTDPDTGHSFQADCIWVSRTVLPRVKSVSALPYPLSSMKHNPIVLVLEY